MYFWAILDYAFQGQLKPIYNLFIFRKRKKEISDDNEFIDDSSGSHKSIKKDESITIDKKKKEEEARQKRIANAKKAPPPVDFNSLLKLANEKKDIPVKIETKVEKKDGEFGDRPMTKKEKEEFIRDQEARLRREGKLPPKERSPVIMEKKPRGSSEEKIEKIPKKPKIRAEPGPSFHSAVLKTMPPPEKRNQNLEKSEAARQMRDLELKMKELEKKKEELETKSKVEEYNRRKRLEYEKKMEELEREKRRQHSEKQERRKLDQDKKKLEEMQQRYKEMQRQLKEKEHRLSSSGSKRDNNSDKSRHLPGDRGRAGGRRIESDSDEDYDSEMDDFIDDSDAKVDISAEIRNIFG